jgi:PAS domain-containing protein
MNPPIDINNKLVKLLPGVYYMLEFFESWEILAVSEQSKALFGYSQHEIVSVECLFTESIIHPQDLSYVTSKKKQSLMEDVLFNIEYRIRSNNGDIKFVRDQYTCYINEDGRWIMEGYINETHHAGVRDRLLQQRQAYRNAVDVNMISSITDNKGTIVYTNDNFCNISKYAKDGSLYWVDTVIIPIFGEHKEIANYLSLRMLINDRKEVERQRANYTDLLESIAAMVAHDVRGPLCSILGVTNLLKNYSNSSEETIRALEYLLVSAEQLNMITLKLSQFLREHEQRTTNAPGKTD